jgi:lysophospholipase L1-like esterase
MRRYALLLVAVLACVVVTGGSAAGSAQLRTRTVAHESAVPSHPNPVSATAHIKRGLYLALGDSAPIWNGDVSYPNLIVSHYKRSGIDLTLTNMACSGETTSSMISGSLCAPGGSQLNNAEAFLRLHRGSVALITIDIGGNDIVYCGGLTGIDERCVKKAEKMIRVNLDSIITGLRKSAGPSVPIASMTYYDPFLGDWLAGGTTQTVALDTVPILVHLNHLITNIYTSFGDRTADVQGAFESTDLQTFVDSPWGSVPVAVSNACSLLDITCQAGMPEGFGDDPNPAGAVVIAEAFETTIGPHLR